MYHVDPGHHLEQLTSRMGRGSIAGRRHVDLAGIGLGVGDELRNRRGRKRWMYHNYAGLAANAGDRYDVAEEIEIELGVECRIDRIRRPDQEKRIAIRRCPYDRLGPNVAGSARAVLNNKGLAELLRQPLTYQTCKHV